MNDRLYYSREAELRAQQQQLILVVIVAVLSVLLGVLATLFLTPKNGTEVRRSISEKFDDVRRDVEERVQNARS